jgi:predicted acylesterase/phospholipase RssA
MGAEVVIAVNTVSIAQQGKDEKSLGKEARNKPNPRPENTHLSSVKRKINDLLRENSDKIKLFDELSHTAKNKIYTGRGKIDPQTPSIFEVLLNSLHAMEYEKIRLATKIADIVITPDVSHIGTFAFYKGEEAISQGYKATRDILPELKNLIRCP